MSLRRSIIFIFLLFTTRANAQQELRTVGVSENIQGEVSVTSMFTSDKQVPFWLRSNQFGSLPIEGASLAIEGKFARDFDKEKKIDWGGGIDARVNIGNRSNFILIEGYLKAKIGQFQVMAGRSRDVDGLVDSDLSSGSFSLSGNALGIPKIELSIKEYQVIPYTNELFAMKGDISYGWMGKANIQYGENKGANVRTLNHHASFYGRFGRPNWKLKMFGAINHDVIWGEDKLIFGDQYNLSDLGALFYVVTGKKYAGAKDISKIGNHLGSLDLALEYDFENIKLRGYRQFFYDKGAIAYLANINDGLTGFSVSNKMKDKRLFMWSKVLVELFYSKDQAGEINAKKTPSGPEYYYNHAVYTDGYSYQGLGLGSPLITPLHFSKKGLVSDNRNFFINNRVVALHLGFMGRFHELDFKLKTTFSRNYGDYRTSGPDEQWYNGGRIKQNFKNGKFTPVNQFSGYLETMSPVIKGYNFGFLIGGDHGKLLNNSVAIGLKINKHL